MIHRICVDIETVPIDSYEEALSPFIESLAGKQKRAPKTGGILGVAQGEDKYQSALRKAALSPVSSRVACIGIHEVTIADNPTMQPTTQWVFLQGDNEADTLGFFSGLIRRETEFITFNGRGFDFPFLMFRAAINGIKLSLPITPYNGRDNHYDMAVHLNECSNLSALDSDPSLKYIGLNKWLKYFGLPEKPLPDGISTGRFVESCVENGNWTELETYCKNDVMGTYELFKRFEGNFKPRERVQY